MNTERKPTHITTYDEPIKDYKKFVIEVCVCHTDNWQDETPQVVAKFARSGDAYFYANQLSLYGPYYSQIIIRV